MFPESADIRPGASATFRVAFRPPRDSAHFCQSLTLCAYMKAMRNFRLLSDIQVRGPCACVHMRVRVCVRAMLACCAQCVPRLCACPPLHAPLPPPQILPPWAIPILASGNTFLHANPELSPKVCVWGG